MAQHGCLPFFYLFLHFILGAGERHECERLCLENEPAKKCYYHFTIAVSQRANSTEDGLGQKIFLSINGRSPGPMISVCENDVIVVDVKNQLPSGLETSLHWHGITGENSPFMDGVPMITQCPILSRTTFRYQMRASKSGSFYYRAHSVAQQLDGIYGPLIINNKKSQLYRSKTIIVAPQLEVLQSLESNFNANLNLTALRLAVFDDFIRDSKNEINVPQRLRIVNVAAMDCLLRLFTHIVPLKVVAVDGYNVKPSSINEIVLNPGERIDLLVKPEVMKVTHIVGDNLCKGHSKYGFDPGISKKATPTVRKNFNNYYDLLQKLEPEESLTLEKGDQSVFIPFDTTVYENFNGVVDFRYKLGENTPYAPSYLTENSVSVIQVHNKSFLYPSSPSLSQPEHIPDDVVCDLKEFSGRCDSDDNGFCECVQVVELPYNKNVDLFIIDEGKNSNVSQTIHIHGYSFYVLGSKSFDKPIRTEDFEKDEARRNIQKNLVNPIKKDSVMVPNKGYVILRLRTSKPGKWLLESTTSKAKLGSGLELILKVNNPLGYEEPPDDFPTCGTLKEPDLVFNDD